MDIPVIPDKHYFRIGEVARLAGVKPSVLRYWESEFGTLRPEKSRTNQRLYTRADIEKVLKLKTLLYEKKFTIAGARRVLAKGYGQELGQLPEETPPRGKEALLARVGALLSEVRLIKDSLR